MQGDQEGRITQLFFAKCVNCFLVQLPPDGDVVGPHNGDQDGDLVDVLHGDGVARHADRLQGPRHKICGQLDLRGKEISIFFGEILTTFCWFE